MGQIDRLGIKKFEEPAGETILMIRPLWHFPAPVTEIEPILSHKQITINELFNSSFDTFELYLR